MDQGTKEWLALRAGHVTASRVADVLATIKSGEAASRANYRAQLIAERLTGIPSETFSNAAMEWGTETEPMARSAYELFKDVMVDQTGFVLHPSIKWSGASPDGLVGDDGLIEIKCPNTATHIEYLINKQVPKKYQPQMNWQMACTGRKWCDFVSYDPRMPEKLRLFVVRFERDEEEISKAEKSVIEFLNEIETTIVKLTEINQLLLAEQA